MTTHNNNGRNDENNGFMGVISNAAHTVADAVRNIAGGQEHQSDTHSNGQQNNHQNNHHKKNKHRH
ncbi:hypothetical protein V1498_09520 [Peribacillus sp. SCS-26]|uniref:hypothetical protein n=1 Tax=Paraperibacillus marinus TaxID=3115295 RepID=UPI00390614CE